MLIALPPPSIVPAYTTEQNAGAKFLEKKFLEKNIISRSYMYEVLILGRLFVDSTGVALSLVAVVPG